MLFILHLFGDFVLQNDWMAENKGKNTRLGYLACLVHCFMYTMPFVCVTYRALPLFLIFATHFAIDKYGLAKKWTAFYKVGWRLNTDNWLHVYLIFMVDMTMHLTCNYLILKNIH